MSLHLPPPLRFVSMGTIALAAFAVLASWFNLLETFSHLNASEIHQAVFQQEPLFSKLYKEEVQVFTEALVASLEARQAGLNDMRTLRTLVLFALSMCATLVLMSGWRLLFREGFSRPHIARILSKTALACAIFRTLDGAQSAALARRAGAAFDLSTASKTNFSQDMETTLTVFSAAFTFSIVALFIWVWRYFQAPRTLALLEATTTTPIPPPPPDSPSHPPSDPPPPPPV